MSGLLAALPLLLFGAIFEWGTENNTNFTLILTNLNVQVNIMK
jgi:hypothetical protein